MSVQNGKSVSSIGGIFGILPVLIFNTPGGAWQPIVDGDFIDNDMVVGDELKDSIHTGKLQILRDSDKHSISIYQAFQKRHKLLVIAGVTTTGLTGGITTSATLIIKEAVIQKFDNPKGGLLSPITRDRFTLRYEGRNAQLKYGSNYQSLVQSEIGKIVGTIVDNVKNVAGQAGL